MTDAELEVIRVANEQRKALKAAASKGPWNVARDSYGIMRIWGAGACDVACTEGDGSLSLEERKSNAAFVAAVRDDPVEEQVDALLAEVQRLRSCYESDNDDVYISRLRDRGYEVSDPHE